MVYQICKRCVMDSSDPGIVFDNNGYCNHCTGAIDYMNRAFERYENNQDILKEIFETIKNESKTEKYDCILGLSGGVDSSYVALLGHKYGLRMLGVHVDAGFNDKVSEDNIRKLVQYCDIDLKILQVDYLEMADLQRAYLRSEVLNLDVPQDHAFLAALYKYAYENKIKYCLNGRNASTENIGFNISTNSASDTANIKAIHNNFGEIPLKKYPLMSFYDLYFKYMLSGKLKFIYPLEIIKFKHEKAWRELKNNVGFQYYGAKHCESIFTRLYQNYIIPKKFGFDKRRAHLSSLIVSEQISRDKALELLSQPGYESKELLEKDIEYVLNFIKMDREEFDEIINKNGWRDYKEFATSDYLYKIKNLGKKFLGR